MAGIPLHCKLTFVDTEIKQKGVQKFMGGQSLLINAEEVRYLLGVSKAYSYRIIKELNTELSSKGFLVIQGRTSRQYFYERIYGKVT